jgi:hypothetical protein
MVVFGPDIARAVVITVHLKNGNGEYITTGATLRYFDTTWKTDALNNGDGTWSITSNYPSLRYEMTFNESQQIKGPFSNTITAVNFQTVRTSVKLFSNTGIALNGGNARFSPQTNWTSLGTTGYGDPMPLQGHTPPVELLPGNYNFEMTYNNSQQQTSVAITEGIPSTTVLFTTVRLTVKLESSSGDGLIGGHPMYYQNGWNNLIVTDINGNSNIDLLPGTYTFRMVYNNTQEDQGPINIGGVSQTVLFSTAAVMGNLLNSNNDGLSGGNIRYYQTSWHSLGSTIATGATSPKELLPGKYYFECEFNDGIQQIGPVNISGTSQSIQFKTTSVTLNSNGSTEYARTTWRSFTSPIELLPGTYYFRADGKLLGQFAISGNSFYRSLIQVELHHSDGQLISSGGSLRYHDGQWKNDAISNDNGRWWVLSASPLTIFEMTYNNSTQQLGPIAVSGPSPMVVFPTTKVTLRLENCKHQGFREGKPRYFQQTWFNMSPTDTDGNSVVELLAGTYHFDMDFNKSRQQKGPFFVEGIAQTIVFQTTEVHITSTAPIEYYNYSWTPLTGTLDLLPGFYFFRVDNTESVPFYLSDCQVKKSLVMVKLLNHRDQALEGGVSRYYSGEEWMDLGTTGSTGKLLALVNPTGMLVEMTYNHVSKKVLLPLAGDYAFHTTRVKLSLKDQDGKLILARNAGAVSFYSPTEEKWIRRGSTGERGYVATDLLSLRGYRFLIICEQQNIFSTKKAVPFKTSINFDFIYWPPKSLEATATNDFVLDGLYPNPFTDRLNLAFTLEKSSPLEISCYNTLGAKVGELINETMQAGAHNLQWNIDLPSGTYILRFVSEGQTWTRKIIKQ